MRAKQKIDIFVHPLKGCYNGRCVINQQFDIVGVMGRASNEDPHEGS